MNGDNPDSNMTSIPSVSLFRGIYNRVAKRLAVDPSYVSRVARGERKSLVVEKALAEEVRIHREIYRRRPDVGVCFYRDINFRGDYFCMERGMSYESLPPGFNDRISSVRIFRRAEVSLFNDSNFRGVSAASRESIPDLRYWRLPTDSSRSWNDRISSIQVR